MKHYVILKSCFAGGERRAVGDVIQLSDSEGNALISMNRASLTDAPKPQEDENRSVGLEESTVAAPKKRKSKNASSN